MTPTGNEKRKFDPEAEARIVRVETPGDFGSDVFDAEPAMMERPQAKRYMPRLEANPEVPEPHYSFNVEIKAQQEALYRQRVAEMKVAYVPVQVFHGKTSREEGFYAVRGPGVCQPKKLCMFDSQKKTWSERDGFEWDGPHETIAEAKAARVKPELARASKGGAA